MTNEWPIIAKSPISKVQAMLIPVTDELYVGGAQDIEIKIWPDRPVNPTYCAFSFRATYHAASGGLGNEYKVLVERLRSAGCDVQGEQKGDIAKGSVYVLAKVRLKRIDGAHALMPMSHFTGTMSQQRGTGKPIADTALNPLNNHISLEELKNGYKVQGV